MVKAGPYSICERCRNPILSGAERRFCGRCADRLARAAARDLLIALRAAAEALREALGPCGCQGQGRPPCTICFAEAAIARAEGGSR